MPLYEYLCESCGQRTEVLQRLEESPLAICPNCSGKLRKLLSAPAFQFKGSGWYLTDYARKSGGDGGGKSSGDAGDKPAGDDGSPSSTPATVGGDAKPAASESAAKPASKPSTD